jgi:hypothetical protein
MQFSFSYGYRPSNSEQQSWAASLPILAQDLVDADLGDVEMLVEYQLPLTSLRADVVPAGGIQSVRQSPSSSWSSNSGPSAGVVDDDPELCVPAGPPGRVVLNLGVIQEYKCGHDDESSEEETFWLLVKL